MKKEIIRHSTLEMSKEQWLAFRANGIGGSEMGVVLGLSPYQSSTELFFKKVFGGSEFEENEAMHWGSALEDLIADRWQYWETDAPTMIQNYKAQRIIRKCRRVNAYLINPKWPHIFCSLDREFRHAVFEGTVRYDQPEVELKKVLEDAVLEIKNISGYTSKQWESGIPPSYVVQLQTYLLVTETNYGEIALLRDGRYMEVIPFERSETICNQIIKKSTDFWQRVLAARDIVRDTGALDYNDLQFKGDEYRKRFTELEPEPDGSVSYEDFLSRRFKAEPLTVAGLDDQLTDAYGYIAAGLQIKEVEEKQREYSNRMKQYMQNAEVMDFGLRGKVTWKENAKGSRVFNVKIKS